MITRTAVNVIIGSILCTAGVALAQVANEPGSSEARQQAIESLQKNLAKNPRDQGLQRALACIERSDQCNNSPGLNRAIERVEQNLAEHPNEGLSHAREILEANRDRIAERRDSFERPAPRVQVERPAIARRPDMPSRPQPPGRPQR